jgi:hypothetical protein
MLGFAALVTHALAAGPAAAAAQAEVDDTIRTGLPLIDVLGDNRGTDFHKARPQVEVKSSRKKAEEARQAAEDRERLAELQVLEARAAEQLEIAKDKLAQKQQVIEARKKISATAKKQLAALERKVAEAQQAYAEAQAKAILEYRTRMLQDEEDALLMIMTSF